MRIAPTFVAYVDEAGDEGYQFVRRPARKSSEWFLLSAAICRVSQHPHMNMWVDAFAKQRGGKAGFHFRKGSHDECVAFTRCVSLTPVRAITVLAHKPSLREDSGLRTQSHMLFDYCAKLLIERISWYAREHRRGEPGVTRIVFSQRRQLKLERITAYLRHLRKLTDMYGDTTIPREARNDIKWDVIDLGQIEMLPHDSLPGLQVADAIVSGCSRAVELSRHSMTEHRFMKMLAHTHWRRRGRCQRYGIKFVPDELPTDDPWDPDRFYWLKHFD